VNTDLRDDLLPRMPPSAGGRDQIGMVAAIRSEGVAAIKSEWWPRSNRNTWPPCVGIRIETVREWLGGRCGAAYEYRAAALRQVCVRLRCQPQPRQSSFGNHHPRPDHRPYDAAAFGAAMVFLAVERPWQPANCFTKIPTASVGGRLALMSNSQPFGSPSLWQRGHHLRSLIPAVLRGFCRRHGSDLTARTGSIYPLRGSQVSD
jgi:hypothetical protein